MASRPLRSVVMELLEDGFGRANRSVFERLVAEDYVQHNPFMPSGRAGLVGLLDELKRIPDNRFIPLRFLEDGDLVLVHSEWLSAGQKRAVFDLFRLRDGLLVEHWDAMQEQPPASALGRTMVDGPTAVKDLERTAANKALVARFLDTALVSGELGALHGFFDGDRYLQHSLGVEDGVSGFVSHLQALAARGAPVRYARVHRIIGEGHFVFAQSEGALGDRRMAFYDLFRVEDGKLAEHWDVHQPIPDTLTHGNGMF
ncbi:nuclear transport factor 2 family protein [Myxococcus landrumensis]|uniref:Nuclear transport factor 2 family protein n=1 Tax=Myxococcus landrumensis TaxID=2813577 RepID=A0ABX7N962_9BACT|nr:nuclear transport factor 2 family protein [Myxococcus landrumus]QSQ15006.1 nuclear transport factor 2 family protein [Myxococcus landrumus]